MGRWDGNEEGGNAVFYFLFFIFILFSRYHI